EKMLSNEKGNYDYLMFADIDFEMNEVREELKQWVKWYVEFSGVAGFRLDAIKHITLEYFNEWLDYIRKETGKELFTVGEYWAPFGLDILERYLFESDFRMSLFDAPLQNKFHQASKQGSSFDLQKLFDNTLLSKHPAYSVTLVDNHDTQPLQALEAPVEDWFKPLAYAIILLRKDGYPCVFYPDLYGAEYTDKGRDGNDYKIILSPVKELPQLLKIRQKYAWGKQINYFDYSSTIGWTRLGDENHSNALAVVISNSNEGFKKMYVGEKFAGKQFVDSLANRSEKITINADGTADFTVNSGSVSVWINI
ncbi:MAG: alpha-amylase, partial [Bacteroidota bacterium]|nr:alpha-amylase [Bacteroidota bacterium]